MSNNHWLELFLRHGSELTWGDIVVGYDFGFLEPRAIQGWVRGLPGHSALERLLALEGEALLDFEACMWEACEACTGKVPRPGSRRWADAQDRWRMALLRDAIAAPLSPQALAVAVQAVYESVGCPEDMLGLWKRGEEGRIESYPPQIIDFLARQERRLLQAG